MRESLWAAFARGCGPGKAIPPTRQTRTRAVREANRALPVQRRGGMPPEEKGDEVIGRGVASVSGPIGNDAAGGPVPGWATGHATILPALNEQLVNKP